LGTIWFVDAFNPCAGWYDPDALGIDPGITMLTAENVRYRIRLKRVYAELKEAQRDREKANFPP
jgi:hypothetical protein